MAAERIKKEIVQMITKLSGKYSPYQVFYDWVHMMAIAMQNPLHLLHNDVWQERENDYIELMKKYNADEQKELIKMFALLVKAMECEIHDYLGEIYMESGCGNKNTGQFFTPYHISRLTADTNLSKELPEKITMYEPSTGAGGMILATADILKERGIDYQRRMKVVAQDLDWLGVYMSYVQFCLIGIDAAVLQGDTLAETYHKGYDERRVYRTAKNMGVMVW